MTDNSRRKFLRFAGLTAVIEALPLKTILARKAIVSSPVATIPFELGMASYTFRAFPLDQALEMTKRLGLKRITLKDMHLPLNSSPSEIAGVVQKVQSSGLELSGCGVIYMTNEVEVDRAFEYAKLAGLRMFIGVPDASLLDVTEKKAKETGIGLAIHNHGPTDKRFPSPESVYNLIAGRDRHLGLCIDVGHTRRLGLDPAKEVEKYFDRVYDVHIKDVTSADAKGTTVEIGRGVIDTPELLGTLVRLGYSRTIHFEHEKDEKDPLPGAAESVGYVKGVLSTL
jgi:inosose dehydratase